MGRLLPILEITNDSGYKKAYSVLPGKRGLRMIQVKGPEYSVVWKDGAWVCSCPSWTKAAPCKHVRGLGKLTEILEGAKK